MSLSLQEKTMKILLSKRNKYFIFWVFVLSVGVYFAGQFYPWVQILLSFSQTHQQTLPYPKTKE